MKLKWSLSKSLVIFLRHVFNQNEKYRSKRDKKKNAKYPYDRRHILLFEHFSDSQMSRRSLHIAIEIECLVPYSVTSIRHNKSFACKTNQFENDFSKRFICLPKRSSLVIKINESLSDHYFIIESLGSTENNPKPNQ